MKNIYLYVFLVLAPLNVQALDSDSITLNSLLRNDDQIIVYLERSLDTLLSDFNEVDDKKSSAAIQLQNRINETQGLIQRRDTSRQVFLQLEPGLEPGRVYHGQKSLLFSNRTCQLRVATLNFGNLSEDIFFSFVGLKFDKLSSHGYEGLFSFVGWGTGEPKPGFTTLSFIANNGTWKDQGYLYTFIDLSCESAEEITPNSTLKEIEVLFDNQISFEFHSSPKFQ
ncbi:MAG: hypothetical protein ACRBBP_08095 [Bdellovibrionales bacterium]